MSVVVRMEMPESCKKCKSTICLWVKDDDLDYMDVIEKVQDFRKKNNDIGFPDFCPIICQLPEGHGDLIDLETAAEGLSERYNSCHMTCGAVMQFLDGLPTIVPAERSET